MAFVRSIPDAEESVAAVMGRYPDMAMPMMQFSEEILRAGDCAFTHEERELIAAFASGLNNCTYCYNTHKATAEAFGVEEGLLDDMVNDLETAGVDEKMKPAGTKKPAWLNSALESPALRVRCMIAAFAGGAGSL